jgi:hypothetical protein
MCIFQPFSFDLTDYLNYTNYIGFGNNRQQKFIKEAGMKKLIVLISVMVLIFSAPMFAKSKTTKTAEKSVKKASSSFEKAIKGEGVEWTDVDQFIATNPLALAFSSLGAHYEFNLDKGSAIAINASVYFWGITGWSTFGLGVGGEYNFYFQEHAPNGWFAGPGLGFQYLSATYNNTSSGTFGFNINGHGGYRWIWDNGFLVDVTAGLGFTMMSLTINNITMPYGGIGPMFGASVGYAWK